MALSRAMHLNGYPPFLVYRTLACGSLLLFGACLGSQRLANPPADVDREVLRNTYLEEGLLVTMAVNTDAARRRARSDYVPLGLVIANNGREPLTANRESLTLADDQGQRYPMASVEEIRSLGSSTVNDYRASNFFATYFFQRLESRPRIRAAFFPDRRGGLVTDRIELPGEAWMIDVVYFPRPAGELLDRTYELTFAPPELDEPVYVRFRIE